MKSFLFSKRIFHSIFSRLILLFLIIIIPLYVVVMLLYLQNERRIENHINEELSMHVATYFQRLQDEFAQMHSAIQQLALDGDLINLIVAADDHINYSKISEINRLRDRLTTLKHSDRLIQRVSIYLPNLSKRLNSAGSNASYDDFDRQLEDTFNSYKHQDSFISVRNNEIFIYYSPINIHFAQTPSFLIEIKISDTDLRNYLAQNSIYSDSISFLVFPTNSYVQTNQPNAGEQKLLEYLANTHAVTHSGVVQALSLPNNYIYCENYNADIQAYYIQLIPKSEALQSMNSFNIWLVVYSACSIFLIFIFYFFANRLVKRPISKMVLAFEQVQNGDFSVRIERSSQDEFHYLYRAFNETIENTQNLISQVYMQKILSQRAELRQLQAQINPHFLYNSFFTLLGRIRKRDFDNAERFCEMLGVYFQYIAKNNIDTTTLGQEVKHARTYAEIQGIRFKNRISVIFDPLPASYEDKLVPKLILQPIIENVFKYGLEERERDGILRVSFHPNNNAIVIFTEDNGSFLKGGEQKLKELHELFADYKNITEITGLINIHKRIKIFLGEECGIAFEKSALGGLGVKLTLMFKEDV